MEQMLRRASRTPPEVLQHPKQHEMSAETTIPDWCQGEHDHHCYCCCWCWRLS